MVSTEDPEAEISQLRVEKAELERRIKELEEHLKGKERKS
jgi:cell division septum initiation protein DivIVA